MTMIVKITDPTRCDPIEGEELDLDATCDCERFVNLFGGDALDVACHLYEGEKIEIECIRRIDEGMF